MLIRSYFASRQKRVKLDLVVSDWKTSIRSCPYGSSSRQLLWNIFQNDMSYKVNNACLSMHMYADDHQLYKKKEIQQNMSNNRLIMRVKQYLDGMGTINKLTSVFHASVL